MIPIKKVYVTKEQADALNVKANCILLNARGKYYYAEEFGKFIEIEEWEYHRILNNPYLYYFSTALKKHFEWCAAVGKARTLTFSDALGQTQSVSGGPEGESVSPAQPNKPTLEMGNAPRQPIALFLSTLCETIERFAQRILKALKKPGLFMEPKTPEEQMLL
jgi:hypothetical protein